MLWIQLQAEGRMQSNTDKSCNSLHRSSEYLAKSQPRTSPRRTRWPLGHRSEEACALHSQQWRHLEKPTAIASRNCCLSSTKQIKTSFLLHWHSSYHCSKNIYSHPTATVGPDSNCLPTLTSWIPFAVMSSSESLQRITPVVSSPMTQPPPWWRTRSVPSSPDTHPYCLPISVSSRSAQRRNNSAGALKRPRFSHLSWVLSVERCARFPLTSQVKTTSCGLKSTLFNRLDVCDRLVVVQALGWGGVTWQRSCRTMYAVENIGVCTNFQWTITSEVNTEYFLFLLSIYIPQQEN